jgi:hypothetical protein
LIPVKLRIWNLPVYSGQEEKKMSGLSSEEFSSRPFWMLLGVLIFFITVFFLAIFLDDSIGLFDTPNDFWQIRRIVFGSFFPGI